MIYEQTESGLWTAREKKIVRREYEILSSKVYPPEVLANDGFCPPSPDNLVDSMRCEGIQIPPDFCGASSTWKIEEGQPNKFCLVLEYWE